MAGCDKIMDMKKIAVFLLALVMAIPAYCVPVSAGVSIFDRSPAEEKRGGTAGAHNIEEAFVKGDYYEVLRIGAACLSRRSKNEQKIQCLMGRALLKLNRFDEARGRFFKAAEGARDEKFGAEANIGVADSYYLNGEYRQARDYYEKAAKSYPGLDSMNIVYYSLGECYSKLDDAGAAKEYYDKLTRLYPDSLEAKLLKGKGSGSVTYCVQAGSFNKLDNAERLRAELKSQGFDAFIQTVMVEGSYFYRVRAGNYSRIKDAEDAARNLRNKGYTTKVCP